MTAATIREPSATVSEARLFARHRAGNDPAARDQLVARFLPLAQHLARRYGRAEREDLEQVASLALLKAIDRFDPDRGIAFSSFAVPTIVGELKRYFRDLGWTVRVPRSVQELKLRLDKDATSLAAQLGRSPTVTELATSTGATAEEVLEALAVASAHRPDSLDRPINDDGDRAIDHLGGQLDTGYARAENRAVVDSLMRLLPERERLILRMRFHEDLTQAEIGARLGISQMHISRLIRQSIATLQLAADERR